MVQDLNPQELLHVNLYLFRTDDEHRRIKAERYDLDVQKDEVYQYESEHEDG